LPVTYEIDAEQGIVTTRLWGVVTDDEVYEHNERLRSDPGFHSAYRQLVDMSGITEAAVTTTMIAETARKQLFTPGSRRAMFASTDEVFGLARMFALRSEPGGQTIEVFRNRSEAEEWLGV
jgi:hypothetical protein